MSRVVFSFSAVVLVAVTIAGCGGSRKPYAANHAVSHSHARAVVGAQAIRRALARRLDARGLEFDLGHPLTSEDLAIGYSDCYVVLGARAGAFEADHPAANFLHAPNGSVIFVQSGSTIPLSRCLTAVRTALGWAQSPKSASPIRAPLATGQVARGFSHVALFTPGKGVGFPKDVHCTHRGGDQYVCTYRVNGAHATALVTDNNDGQISASAYR